MRAFVWQGGEVLKNYSSGLVVVLAADEPAAWDKLRQDNLEAFVQLLTGHSFCLDSVMDLEWCWKDLDDCYDDKIKKGFPILPQSFALDAAPAFVQRGGE